MTSPSDERDPEVVAQARAALQTLAPTQPAAAEALALLDAGASVRGSGRAVPTAEIAGIWRGRRRAPWVQGAIASQLDRLLAAFETPDEPGWWFIRIGTAKRLVVFVGANGTPGACLEFGRSEGS